MNNLEKLITENALDVHGILDKSMFFLVIFLLILIVLLIFFPPGAVVAVFALILYVSLPTFKTDDHSKNIDKSTILKENYNIKTKEKDEIIEVFFNKKKNSVGILKDDFKDNFKVFLEKTNEGKYYVYFDENKKDKKEVSLNEIKETFSKIEKVEVEKFSLSEINNEERK